MQWKLPGGAVLQESDERALAVRPGVGVGQRVRLVREGVAAPPNTPQPNAPPPSVADAPTEAPKSEAPRPAGGERLVTLKVILEIVALVVGLIGTVLALFGVSQK